MKVLLIAVGCEGRRLILKTLFWLHFLRTMNFTSQKISASQLDSKLRGFGRSLAGGMDLDTNGYNGKQKHAYFQPAYFNVQHEQTQKHRAFLVSQM